MKTIRLDDSKYEFDLDDHGLIVSARRHGVYWPAGMELRYTGVFLAALHEIEVLREKLNDQ